MISKLFSIVLSVGPRKDKYNKKIKKYRVVYGEDEEELSEEEEKEERKDQEASCKYTAWPNLPNL